MATLRLDMKAERAFLLAGSLWEIVRFFLLLSLLALLLQGTSGSGRRVFPWLILGGSGNLLVAAGGILLAAFPARYGSVLGLLRLGKILGIFSFLLLLLSGALRPSLGLAALSIGKLAIGEGAMLLGIFALDVLFLAVLLAWRGTDKERVIPEGAGLPELTETEVGDYH